MYRYLATDLITGEIRADWLPLEVSNFGRTLGGAADLSGALPLTASDKVNRAYINALEPRRTVLWVLDDATPVWAGVLWDWPHSSIASNQLPIRAATIESLFDHREVRIDQVFTGADSLDIFRALLTYATSGFVGKNVYGIRAPANQAGDAQTITWPGTDAKKILAAWKDFAASSDFEFTFDPVALPDQTYGWQLRLGAPTLGLAAGASNLALQYPGNIVDYSWPRTGAGSSNAISAVANASGDDGASVDWRSRTPHGFDYDDINAGYPLLEDTVTYSGTAITAQPVIDTYADTVVHARTRTATTPTVTLGGPGRLRARDLTLGSWAWLLATSNLHPADPTTGAPGLQKLVRIVGWTVNPATGDQPETIVLTLGEVDAT